MAPPNVGEVGIIKNEDPRQKGQSAAPMPDPTDRQLEQRAEEGRAVAGQMRHPFTRRMMANLALTYERLAEHARMREASEVQDQATPEMDRGQAA